MSGNPTTPTYGFDLLYLRRFWKIHQILFPGLGSFTFGLFTMLLVISLGEQFLVYQVGLISGTFYKVLGEKDWDAFKAATLNSVAIILAMTLIKSLRVFVTRTMTVEWRKCLNLALHKLYFTGIRYYQLNVLDEYQLDNPDQRMTADIELLCTKYGSVITDLILAPFLISYYSYSAFSRSGWIGPTAMFIFFLVSTMVNKLLMSPIVNLSVEREKREGDFRFKHVSIRVSAESLAFHDSARVEALKVDAKLFTLCNVQQTLYNRQLFLDLSTNSFDYLGSIASYLVIAVPIFSGAYDGIDASQLAQVIAENAFVCIYLIFQFSKLVDMSSTMTSMAGVTHRIMELAEGLSNLKKTDDDDDDDSDDLTSILGEEDDDKSGLIFSLHNVTVSAPKCSVPLISNLNMDFEIGKNTLIMGRSSAGKSSVLRILRGLWPPRTGSMERHGREKGVIFMPQKTFFTNGSLREQIVYPLVVSKELVKPSDDEWIVNTLAELGLGDLLRRCGGDLDHDPLWNWPDVLSPGEMQRLGFIRLFFHRPVMAFLDEATSALSGDIEELLYQRCIDLNITLVSVGHRENLKKYHKTLVHIGLAEGAWTLEETA